MSIKICLCGCGERVRNRFVLGHEDQLKDRLREACEKNAPLVGLPFRYTDPWKIARSLGWLDEMPPPPVVEGKKEIKKSLRSFGHSKPIGNKENEFRIRDRFLSDVDEVMINLLERCTKYVSLPRIFSVFRETFGDGGAPREFSRFLSCFGGVEIKFPVDLSEEALRYTLLPEIMSLFGEDLAWNMVEEFNGRVKVPPSSFLADSMRDMDILCSLRDSSLEERRTIVKLLANHYDITPHETQRIARRLGV